MRSHLRIIARHPVKAVDTTLGKVLSLIGNVLGVLAPAFLSKEGVGQSGG